jgi:hypothetical protein
MDQLELRSQLTALIDSLGRMKPDQRVDVRIGKIANVLIAEAKKAAPDNPVLSTVTEFGFEQGYVKRGYVGSFRTIMVQVLESVPKRAPSIA